MKKVLTTLSAAALLALAYQVAQADIASHLCVPGIGCLIGDGTNFCIDSDGDNVGCESGEANITMNAPTNAAGDETVQGDLVVVGTLTSGDLTATSATITPSATPNILFTDSTTAGEARIAANDAAGPDTVLSIDTDIAGVLTAFLEADGVTETVDILKPLVVMGETNPAEDGVIRLDFGDELCWENGTPGEDLCIDTLTTNTIRLGVNGAATTTAVSVALNATTQVEVNAPLVLQTSANPRWFLDDTVDSDGTAESSINGNAVAADNGRVHILVEQADNDYLQGVTVCSDTGAAKTILGPGVDADGTGGTCATPTGNGFVISEAGAMTTLGTGVVISPAPIASSTGGALAINTITLATAAADYDIPDNCDSATGSWVVVYVRDASEIVSITTTDTSDIMVIKGTAGLIANDEADSPQAVGDMLSLVCMATDTWYATGVSGTWVDGGPAD